MVLEFSPSPYTLRHVPNIQVYRRFVAYFSELSFAFFFTLLHVTLLVTYIT